MKVVGYVLWLTYHYAAATQTGRMGLRLYYISRVM